VDQLLKQRQADLESEAERLLSQTPRLFSGNPPLP
jgi:hypothetical protein